MNEKNKILEYIIDNFYVDRVSINLIGSIYDYLFDTTENYMKDFIKILNEDNIDITIEELKENNIIE